jgi:hypothetical protein
MRTNRFAFRYTDSVHAAAPRGFISTWEPIDKIDIQPADFAFQRNFLLRNINTRLIPDKETSGNISMPTKLPSSFYGDRTGRITETSADED